MTTNTKNLFRCEECGSDFNIDCPRGLCWDCCEREVMENECDECEEEHDWNDEF